jgi:hypothetical protein
VPVDEVVSELWETADELRGRRRRLGRCPAATAGLSK